MKPLRVIVLCLLVPAALIAQTNVDKLVKALDSLSLASFDDWKMSPDLKVFKPNGDPTKTGYDDSGWQTLKLNQNVYPDSCWLRKEIVLPEKILGKPIAGPMKILVSVDDYGYLWINGVSTQPGAIEFTRIAGP